MIFPPILFSIRWKLCVGDTRYKSRASSDSLPVRKKLNKLSGSPTGKGKGCTASMVSGKCDSKGGFFSFFMYVIQHCFICRPSDSTVSEEAGIEPRTVATLALTDRRSNHLARSHPQKHVIVGREVGRERKRNRKKKKGEGINFDEK